MTLFAQTSINDFGEEDSSAIEFNGFPLFSCIWMPNGVFITGGGGGLAGTGVKSGFIVAKQDSNTGRIMRSLVDTGDHLAYHMTSDGGNSDLLISLEDGISVFSVSDEGKITFKTKFQTDFVEEDAFQVLSSRILLIL